MISSDWDPAESNIDAGNIDISDISARRGRAFHDALLADNADVVRIIVLIDLANPQLVGRYLSMIVMANKTEILKSLASNDTCRFIMKQRTLLHTAASHGNIEAVKYLIDDPDVDPSDMDNFAIHEAARYNYFDIVKLLASHSRFNNSLHTKLNDILIIAASKGQSKMVEWLLKHPEVDPTYRDNRAVLAAASYIKTLRVLMADPRVNPAANRNAAIIRAACKRKFDCIEVLLSDPRVDPAAQDNIAFRMAVQAGHLQLVTLLLERSYVDSYTHDIFTQIAKEKDHYAVFELLQEEQIALKAAAGHKESINKAAIDPLASVGVANNCIHIICSYMQNTHRIDKQDDFEHTLYRVIMNT